MLLWKDCNAKIALKPGRKRRIDGLQLTTQPTIDVIRRNT